MHIATEIVQCKDCEFYETEECRWRKDEIPFEEDFCSFGVKKEEEDDE